MYRGCCRRKVEDGRDRQLKRHLHENRHGVLQRRRDLGREDVARARASAVAVAHGSDCGGHGRRKIRRCDLRAERDTRDRDAEHELDGADGLDEVHLDCAGR